MAQGHRVPGVEESGPEGEQVDRAGDDAEREQLGERRTQPRCAAAARITPAPPEGQPQEQRGVGNRQPLGADRQAQRHCARKVPARAMLVRAARLQQAARGHQQHGGHRHFQHGDARLDEQRLVEDQEQGRKRGQPDRAEQHARDPEEGRHRDRGEKRARQPPAQAVVAEQQDAGGDRRLGEKRMFDVDGPGALDQRPRGRQVVGLVEEGRRRAGDVPDEEGEAAECQQEPDEARVEATVGGMPGHHAGVEPMAGAGSTGDGMSLEARAGRATFVLVMEALKSRRLTPLFGADKNRRAIVGSGWLPEETSTAWVAVRRLHGCWLRAPAQFRSRRRPRDGRCWGISSS